MSRWIVFWALISLLTRSAWGQLPAATAEVAVNGPEGALLLVDGQAMGTLPLAVNLTVAPGPHRFRLELGNQKVESDSLTLPANRRAELNLTLSGRTLVAVLRITSGLLLLLQPETLPSALRGGITAAVAAAAKQEHAVLLGSDKPVELLRRQARLLRCVEEGDCHESLLGDGQASYVMSLQVKSEPPESARSYHLTAVLLDTRTSDISARAEESCSSCDLVALAAKGSTLTARLLQATAIRPRGSMTISSSPDAARVIIDGRWLGLTPFQREVFAGSHVVELQRDRHLPYKETIQVEAGQTASVQAALQPTPPTRPPPLARPLWRIVTGSLLAGTGVILVGLGASALSINGQCKDGSGSGATCTPYYDTAAVGGGLLGGGAALTIAGTIMLAVPRSSPSP